MGVHARTPGRAKRVAQQRPRALGGVAPAPRVGAQPVAQLDLAGAPGVRLRPETSPAARPVARSTAARKSARPIRRRSYVAQRGGVRGDVLVERVDGGAYRREAVELHQRVEVGLLDRAQLQACVRTRREPLSRARRPTTQNGPPEGDPFHTNNRRRPTLPGPCGPSTIGAEGLNCSVRNGKRCFPLAMTTGIWRDHALPEALQNRTAPHRVSKKPSSPRTISTGLLRTSLRFQIRPINLVVYQGPYSLKGMGELISRPASRLDAFSGYPIHT